MDGTSLTTPMTRWSCSSKPAARVIPESSSYWSDQMVSCPHWLDLSQFNLRCVTLRGPFKSMLSHQSNPQCEQVAISYAVCPYMRWHISSLSHSAIYDVVEEKVDSEPDFQYIPEKCPQDPAQLDQHALRDSMVTLKEGLSSGAILAQFDVR